MLLPPRPSLGWVRLTGWIAWVLWGVVHIFFLIGFRNRVPVFLNWIWAWLTYGRGARLTRRHNPLAVPVKSVDRCALGLKASLSAATDQVQHLAEWHGTG